VKVNDLIAIDVHTHAEVSCRQEPDEASKPYDDAASKYFKADKRKTIPETVAYYRERKIGLVMFTVDTEFEMGVRRFRSNVGGFELTARAVQRGINARWVF
jgi:hypothetical protein